MTASDTSLASTREDVSVVPCARADSGRLPSGRERTGGTDIRRWKRRRASAPYIAVRPDEPGIRGLFRFRPETALPLNQLCDALLSGDGRLSRGERELIAAYVSSLNQTRFCFLTHAAFAATRLPEGMSLVKEVCDDLESARVPAKLKALLSIAGSVQQDGKDVTERQVATARRAGATDLEIHDAVLIAAAFCMFNRYVDGLATYASDDPAHYAARARLTDGYVAVVTDALREA